MIWTKWKIKFLGHFLVFYNTRVWRKETNMVEVTTCKICLIWHHMNLDQASANSGAYATCSARRCSKWRVSKLKKKSKKKKRKRKKKKKIKNNHLILAWFRSIGNVFKVPLQSLELQRWVKKPFWNVQLLWTLSLIFLTIVQCNILMLK